jgi:dTDP-3-amino-3,4,6-trideoxy-alpha-D-glucose transaminase
MGALRALAQRHNLALLEDAAQAHGARLDGVPAGSLGLAATFSFYPSKNLGAFGDGGAVVTSSPEIALHVRRARDGGQTARYRHETEGVNSRLDELQAAILSVRLRTLEAGNDRRRAIAAHYETALAGAPDVTPVGTLPGAEPARHLFVVRSAARDGLAAHLARSGVTTAVHYPIPIHKQPAFASEHHAPLPVAEAAASDVLSLPLFPELTDTEVERVAAALKDWVHRAAPGPASDS